MATRSLQDSHSCRSLRNTYQPGRNKKHVHGKVFLLFLSDHKDSHYHIFDLWPMSRWWSRNHSSGPLDMQYRSWLQLQSKNLLRKELGRLCVHLGIAILRDKIRIQFQPSYSQQPGDREGDQIYLRRSRLG